MLPPSITAALRVCTFVDYVCDKLSESPVRQDWACLSMSLNTTLTAEG